MKLPAHNLGPRMLARVISHRTIIKESLNPWVMRMAWVPVVGLIVIFPIYLRTVALIKARKTCYSLDDLDRRAAYLKDIALRKSPKPEISVTPFKSPCAQSAKMSATCGHPQ